MSEVLGNEQSLSFVFRCFDAFFGNRWVFWIFLIAAAVMLCAGYKKHSRYMAVPVITVVLLLTVYNPLIVHFFVSRKLIDSAVYYRFLWLLPVPFTLAFILVWLIGKVSAGVKKKLVGWAAALAAALLILFPGGAAANISKMFCTPTNIYKVPVELIEACRIIHEDDEEGYPRVVFSDDLEVFARQYDPAIQLTIDRDVRLSYNGSTMVEKPARTKHNARRRFILKAINEVGSVTTEKFRTCMENCHTKYIVIPASWPTNAFLMSSGCKSVGMAGEYVVYRYVPREDN